jgi:L-alanine-DL-glutamate epimerase-like enolase superfamily enzyme
MPKINDNGIVREMTPEEIAEMAAFEQTPAQRIEMLKSELASTDYKAIKYAEGWMTDEEYAPIKAARQALRDEINALEKEI